ncbi:hypothetical protein D9M70_652570 [compost metagenome]
MQGAQFVEIGPAHVQRQAGKQRLLAGEVLVHRALADAGGNCDLGDGHPIPRLLAKQQARGVEEGAFALQEEAVLKAHGQQLIWL